MGLAKLGFSAAILFSAITLASCAEKFPQDIPEHYTVPDEHTFSVPYEKAWQEVVQTISGENRIRTKDKEGGVIVTEVAVVDNGKSSRTSSEASTFGRTYKNSYSVKLTEAGPGRTTINVQANLVEEYFAIYNRECNIESFAAFLRQELFRKICGDLYRNPAKCLALFPSYNSAVCLPVPKAAQASADEVSHPDLDPMWKLEINVRDLQKALAREGYDPGPIDGRMGKKTRAALTRFQKDHKLEPSGKLDESTMIALEI